MYIYNITSSVDDSIEQDWAQHVRENYIPQALATGVVSSAELVKVIHALGQDSGKSYAIQLRFENLRDLDVFKKEHEVSVERSLSEAFPGGYLTFRLVLRSFGNQKKGAESCE